VEGQKTEEVKLIEVETNKSRESRRVKSKGNIE